VAGKPRPGSRSWRGLPTDENGQDRIDRKVAAQTIKRREDRGREPRPNADDSGAKETIRLLQNEIGNLRKMALDHRAIREEVLKIAHAKPPVPGWLIAPGAKARRGPGVPSLFLSDLHWGEVVKASEIGGVNSYDLKTAHARLRVVINGAVELLTRHMVNPSYPGIVMILGGDMLSGNIHDELKSTNAQEVMPCLLDLFGAMIWAIEAMADQFGAVFLPCVTGNHGRNTLKIQAKERHHTNFDWLLYQLLDRHFAKDKRVTFLIPDGPDALFKVFGHSYLLTHGDQFRGGDGMIGALGPIIRGDHKKRSRNAQIGQEYDTLLLGHWHQLIQMQRLVVNGSLCGYNEYANQGNFGFEPPRQALWITHPERGITFQMPVQASEPTKSSTRGTDWVSVPRIA
jgi:predicted phosphodiesterase